MALAAATASSSSGVLRRRATSAIPPTSKQLSRSTETDEQRTASTKFVVDWNHPTTEPSLPRPRTNEAEDLQKSFRRFRQQRMDAIRLQKGLDETTRKKKVRRSNPRRMHRLRLKFVEQAKKYLGVPYGRKYFQPGTPEYESKLFLDCCGLVRRVMYDLSKDFGFLIGPWNQSYMHDTLPKTITHLSEVQPGDLVFISAIYHNPKMKKQRHNLTHVEIMLGDGEKTIGARWNDGKVQFFDSYKFTSKSYHSQIYTIKSLDPWLKGICQSYCPEHSWHRRATKINRKSIFYSSERPRREGSHRRSHSTMTRKGTSGSSSSSINSSNRPADHHPHRRRRRRTTRSKSHQRSSSAKLPSSQPRIDETGEGMPSETPSRRHDDAVNVLSCDIAATLKCDDEREDSDDSDSLDQAIDAEGFDEENDTPSHPCGTTTERFNDS